MELNFNKEPKFTLSANEIRQYGECARKRYYASRDCLAIRVAKVGKNLKLGSMFHATLEYYYSTLDKMIKEAGLINPSIEEAKNLLDQITPYDVYMENKAIEEGTELVALDASEKATYDCIVANYMQHIPEDLSMYEVVECESSFAMDNWPIDDVRYHGFIDMVVRDREDGKIYFFEHKTCAGFRPDIYNRFDIQLHIYDAYGYKTYGDEYGGMLLNEVKKAKTARGYDDERQLFVYNNAERADFFNWLKKKTEGLVSPNNHHEPCNNYMSCKMCEYSSICMKYGYEVPKSTEEIINDNCLVDEEGDALYVHDPRIAQSGEEND